VDVPNNRWTLDRSAGTAAQTATGNMGGAFASPGKAGGVIVGGNTVWVKAGTYTMSSSSNVAAGRVTVGVSGTATSPTKFLGYNAARGDYGTKPVLRAGANSMTIITISNPFCWVRNFEFEANAQTGIEGLQINGNDALIRGCLFDATTSYGVRMVTGNKVVIYDCRFEGCSGTACISFSTSSLATKVLFCVADAGTGVPSHFDGPGTWDHCVSIDSPGVGFSAGGNGVLWANCIAYNASTDGFDAASTGNVLGLNCIGYSSGDRNFEGTATGPGSRMLINCAGGGAAADYDSADWDSIENFTALSGDPFEDAAAGDFNINNTAGAGTALRAVTMDLDTA
jgi:hypothetical protein